MIAKDYAEDVVWHEGFGRIIRSREDLEGRAEELRGQTRAGTSGP